MLKNDFIKIFEKEGILKLIKNNLKYKNVYSVGIGNITFKAIITKKDGLNIFGLSGFYSTLLYNIPYNQLNKEFIK